MNYNLIINYLNTHHNKDTKLQRVNASRLSWIPRISKQAYRPAWSTGCSAEQGINSARTAPGFASLTLGVMEYLTNNSTNPIYQVQPYVGLQYHRNRNSIQTLIYWSNLIYTPLDINTNNMSFGIWDIDWPGLTLHSGTSAKHCYIGMTFLLLLLLLLSILL